MKVENVVVDLQRELSKLKEAMTSESSVAENGRNEKLVSQMGCTREAPNEVSLEKNKLSLLLKDKERKLETTTELQKMKTAQVESLNIASKFMGEFC